jgi:putative nucleotidyltransferase with HDIG domain
MPKTIDDFVASVDFLPPSFHLLPRLLLLLEDVESNADALAELIRVDPGLTADILRVCNSAAYASRFRAETMQEAILQLGFHEVHRIVMSVIASPILSDPAAAYPGREPDLWNHSLAAALATRQLPQNTAIEPDIAFTAALLHDVGKIVMAKAIPEQFRAAVAFAAERRQPLYQVERAQYKTDHAAVGAQLLQRWGFPKKISAAVQFHHEPHSAGAENLLASCVYLANILAYRIKDDFILPEYVLSPDAGALRQFRLTQPAFEALAPSARDEFVKLVEQFR